MKTTYECLYNGYGANGKCGSIYRDVKGDIVPIVIVPQLVEETETQKDRRIDLITSGMNLNAARDKISRKSMDSMLKSLIRPKYRSIESERIYEMTRSEEGYMIYRNGDVGAIPVAIVPVDDKDNEVSKSRLAKMITDGLNAAKDDRRDETLAPLASMIELIYELYLVGDEEESRFNTSYSDPIKRSRKILSQYGQIDDMNFNIESFRWAVAQRLAVIAKKKHSMKAND